MLFMQFLKNLDELLFEVMSWLLFYPITLWRSLRHPLQMMHYADTELGKPADREYTDAVSPPVFLLLTLVAAHIVELVMTGDNPIVADHHGVANLINDDNTLLLLRLVSFALFPLVMAARMLRRQRRKLERELLKPLFYSQCYVTAPFALTFSLATTLSRTAIPHALPAALWIAAAAAVWYVVLQTIWFRQKLAEPWSRAIVDAATGYAVSLGLLAAASLLFA